MIAARGLHHPGLERGLYRLGVFALFFFAFFSFLHTAHANQGLLLMLFMATAHRRVDLGALAIDRMLLLSLAFLIYLIVRTLWGSVGSTGLSTEAWEAVKRWPFTGFFGIALVAYWLSRLEMRPETLLAVAMAGFLVRILSRLEWTEITGQLLAFVSGASRATFGYSAVNLGIWSAIALLGLLVFQGRVRPKARPWPLVLAGMALWLAAIGIVGLALLFSQARSAWLSVLIVVPPILLASLYARFRSKKAFMIAALSLLAVGVITVYQFAQTPLVQQRIQVEAGAIERASRGEPSDGAAVGVGLRLAMYRVFWQEWRKNPVFGWGPGTMRKALDDSGVNALTAQRFEHFHSSYLSVLFQFGIIGGAFVGAMFLLLFQQILRGHREGAMPLDVFLFLLGSLAIFMVGALANEPLQSSNGPYLICLLGGIAFSYSPRKPLPTAPLGSIGN